MAKMTDEEHGAALAHMLLTALTQLEASSHATLDRVIELVEAWRDEDDGGLQSWDELCDVLVCWCLSCKEQA